MRGRRGGAPWPGQAQAMRKMRITTPFFTLPGQRMDSALIAFWLTILGAACWPVCFLWMHHISSRQESLLKELREQGQRIEELSRIEHDLIREVHPQVGEIRDNIEAVAQDIGVRREEGA
jgi:hypothetical protein